MPQITGNLDQQPIIIPEFEIENDFFEMELPPRVHDLVDSNETLKQKLRDFIHEVDDTKKTVNSKFIDSEINIKADTIRSIFW